MREGSRSEWVWGKGGARGLWEEGGRCVGRSVVSCVAPETLASIVRRISVQLREGFTGGEE